MPFVEDDQSTLKQIMYSGHICWQLPADFNILQFSSNLFSSVLISNCQVSEVIMLPGPAQFKLLKSFVPSLATYGVCAGTVVVYMASEWKGKDLLQFVPIYNR